MRFVKSWPVLVVIAGLAAIIGLRAIAQTGDIQQPPPLITHQIAAPPLAEAGPIPPPTHAAKAACSEPCCQLNVAKQTACQSRCCEEKQVTQTAGCQKKCCAQLQAAAVAILPGPSSKQPTKKPACDGPACQQLHISSELAASTFNQIAEQLGAAACGTAAKPCGKGTKHCQVGCKASAGCKTQGCCDAEQVAGAQDCLTPTTIDAFVFEEPVPHSPFSVLGPHAALVEHLVEVHSERARLAGALEAREQLVASMFDLAVENAKLTSAAQSQQEVHEMRKQLAEMSRKLAEATASRQVAEQSLKALTQVQQAQQQLMQQRNQLQAQWHAQRMQQQQHHKEKRTWLDQITALQKALLKAQHLSHSKSSHGGAVHYGHAPAHAHQQNHGYANRHSHAKSYSKTAAHPPALPPQPYNPPVALEEPDQPPALPRTARKPRADEASK